MKLYPYQSEGRSWLAGRDRALLADEMGLGKTPQALMAIPHSRDKPRVLVVCPASLKENWARECRTWRPDLEPVVLSGRRGFRWPDPCEVAIVNYDILPGPTSAKTWAARCPVELVVIADEAHYLKSRKAQRTKSFDTLASTALRFGAKVWLLTGTPLLSTPLDLLNVLKAARLDKTTFESWPVFVKLFRGYRGRWGWQFRGPQPAVAERLKKVMLRRHRLDVLPDLPAKRHQHLYVDLPRLISEQLDDVRDDLEAMGIDLEAAVREADDSVLSKSEVMKRLSSVRQVLAVAKMGRLVEEVQAYEDAGEPLVVFSAHRAPVEALASRPGWKVILGGTSLRERDEAVQAFQAGKLKGIAGTVGAMGVGLTLTRASHAVFVDLSYTPAENSQAEDRICRIGQDRGVLIKRIVANHVVDKHVTAILARKQEMIEGSVEAAAAGREQGTLPGCEPVRRHHG